MFGGAGSQMMQQYVPPPVQTQQEPPETRFASQLQYLEEMGFRDRQQNITALLATDGDVDSATEYLISLMPE
jgi:ubiquilin